MLVRSPLTLPPCFCRPPQHVKVRRGLRTAPTRNPSSIAAQRQILLLLTAILSLLCHLLPPAPLLLGSPPKKLPRSANPRIEDPRSARSKFRSHSEIRE